MTTLDDDDNIYVSAIAGETVFGRGGNDTLTAAAGGGVLYGEDGNDTLNGSDGNDTLFGDNSPNLTYTNVLNGNGGDDIIYSYAPHDQIDGGSGNDHVYIYATTITTGGGSGQIVNGGDDSDTLHLYALADISDPVHIVMGSTFAPTIGSATGSTFTNFETLDFRGGSGALTIEGAGGNDFLAANTNAVATFDAGSLKGMGGDDTLYFNGNPGSGIEALDGGSGTDTLLWTPGNSDWSSHALVIDDDGMRRDGTQFASFVRMENLTINASFASPSSINIKGFQGVNTLTLNAASIEVVTFGGNDFINIISGAATVSTGDGNDVVTINASNTSSSTIHGNAGNDTLHGGFGQDAIYGDAGNDNLSASNGKTSLFGGAGNDTLYLTSSYANNGTGSATLDGGGGNDRLTLELSLSGKTFKANFSTASVTLADGTKILNCEAVSFTASTGNDKLTASNDAAGLSVNKLFGLGGNDTLTAGSRGAWLDGGAGDDMLIAGSGADYLIGGYNETNIKGDTVSYARSKSGVTVDLTVTSAQQSKGDAAGDVLSRIENLIGSSHNDVLKGNGVNAMLFASGKNVLDGGAGNDRLTGGSQSDTFVFSTGYNKDIITDFAAKGAEHDVLDLSGLASITSFADLKAHHLERSGHNVVIDGLHGDTITLLNVAIKDLGKADFLF